MMFCEEVDLTTVYSGADWVMAMLKQMTETRKKLSTDTAQDQDYASYMSQAHKLDMLLAKGESCRREYIAPGFFWKGQVFPELTAHLQTREARFMSTEIMYDFICVGLQRAFMLAKRCTSVEVYRAIAVMRAVIAKTEEFLQRRNSAGVKINVSTNYPYFFNVQVMQLILFDLHYAAMRNTAKFWDTRQDRNRDTAARTSEALGCLTGLYHNFMFTASTNERRADLLLNAVFRESIAEGQAWFVIAEAELLVLNTQIARAKACLNTIVRPIPSSLEKRFTKIDTKVRELHAVHIAPDTWASLSPEVWAEKALAALNTQVPKMSDRFEFEGVKG